MRPEDQVSNLVTFQPVEVREFPDRPEETHLLVPKGTTGYLNREEAREWAIELRSVLVEVLEAHGLVKAASKLAHCGQRVLPIVTGGRTWRIPLGCGAAYCPVCVLRRRDRLFGAMVGRVAACMGTGGAAALLTLAQPTGLMPLLHRLEKLAKEVRSAKQDRIWRKQFRHTLGVVMGSEIEGGSHQEGFPHVHLFVFSHDPEEIQTFVAWMRQRWVRRVKWELLDGLQVITLSANQKEWGPRLRYVLKGSELNPDWPAGLLGEAVVSLSAGKRLFTCWGLARHKGGWLKARRRGARNVAPLRTVAASRLRSTG